jgi:PiT family inorganic phosphate transporter
MGNPMHNKANNISIFSWQDDITEFLEYSPVLGNAAVGNGPAAMVMQDAAWAGMPISTTHLATTTIMGVGSAYRIRAVRWGPSRRIVGAWVLTLPASASAGGLIAWIFGLFGLR